MGTRPHPRDLEILRFLARGRPAVTTGDAYAVGGGEPPTQREIAKALGYKSSRTVPYHLDRLEEGGYLERSPAPSRKRRPIRITQKGWEAVGEVPVLGRIAAGRGMEAVPMRETGELMALLAGGDGRSRFLLEARGQSMTGAGIEDGDLLLVAQDPSPPDGTVVAAMLGGGEEVTVKRLFREGSAVRLKAENGGHADIVAPAGEVEVQGRVELILRRPWRR